jgi:hypothetical protein
MSLQKPGRTKAHSGARTVKRATLGRKALGDLEVRKDQVKGGVIYGDWDDGCPPPPKGGGTNGNGYYN